MNFLTVLLSQLVFLQLVLLDAGVAAQHQTRARAVRETGTLSGQVLLNGQPISGVKVALQAERVTDPSEAPATSESDSNGQYRFTGLAAGRYYLSIPDRGFVLSDTTGPRGKMITLADGEDVENIDLNLNKGGVVIGRVTDSDGRPLIGARIQFTKVGDDGKPQPSPLNHPGMDYTNIDGVYRIVGVPDGHYLVSASPLGNSGQGSGLKNSYYARSFHPGVLEESRARMIDVRTGFETTGIDISIPEIKRTYEIKGRVVYADSGQPAAGVRVIPMPISGDGRTAMGQSRFGELSNADGFFEIQGLAPGKYSLYSRGTPGNELFFTEPVVCEITGAGLDGIELKMQKGGAISGVFVVEGSSDPGVSAKLKNVAVGGFYKTKQHVAFSRETAKLNSDGTFRMTGLPPGKVQFMLVQRPMVGGFSIKRVERDGVSQPEGLEVGSGEDISNVRVVVVYGAVTVQGEIRVIGGVLPPHRGIYINATLLTDPLPGRTIGVNVDARGRFVLENLLPGEYDIRLVNLVLQPGEPKDPALTKLISGISQRVLVSNDSNPAVTLVIDLSQKESRR